MDSADERMARALCSLEGLSVGDGFGERFFFADTWGLDPAQRQVPAPPWTFTDDTQMALSIVDTLREFGHIDQDYLAASFTSGFDRRRGYGPNMLRFLARLHHGEKWQEIAPKQFGGAGSWGNGSAMRVAPLGAYFADDPWQAVDQAVLSAVVTHTHAEAQAGAIAVAVAAALAGQYRRDEHKPTPNEFIDSVIAYTPGSDVLDRLIHARRLPAGASVYTAASVLGCGREVSCPDTVPFDIWVAAQHLDNYEDALWAAVSPGGDIDTNAAIVGGIVVMYTGCEAIPAEWRQAREPLPAKPEGWVVDFL